MNHYQPGTTVLGRYTVTGLLGSGATASVYRARDTMMNRTVAIKILDKDNARLSARGFAVEARAAALLSHPNIVNVYDIQDGVGEKFIIMEYVYGITLRDYMEFHGHLSVKECVNCARQVLAALNAAHSQGIVHRDIKPGNILITTEGRVKVTDFGIARLPGHDAFLMPDRTVGTVRYVSPEQAGGGAVDERSDLYAVGVLMYEMLTGRCPFEAENPIEVLSMQRNLKPTPPTCYNPDIPSDVEKIVLCALEKSPDARFDSAAEMIRVLDKLPDQILPNAVRPLTEDTSAYRRMTEKNNEKTECELPLAGKRRHSPEKERKAEETPSAGEGEAVKTAPGKTTEKKQEFVKNLEKKTPLTRNVTAGRHLLDSFSATDTIDIMTAAEKKTEADNEVSTEDFSVLQRKHYIEESEGGAAEPKSEGYARPAAPKSKKRKDAVLMRVSVAVGVALLLWLLYSFFLNADSPVYRERLLGFAPDAAVTESLYAI